MVANARDFLLAIKESTHVAFDEDATEFLDGLREAMSRTLDSRQVRSDERDSIFFFEGMLRGLQIKLTARKQKAAALLQETGLLGPDGKPRLPDA